MTKKIRLAFAGFLAIAAIVTCAVVTVQIAAARGETIQTMSQVQEDEGYLLKAYEGYVGVYYSGEDYPALITDISLDTLRAHDRELMEAGYQVANRDELMKVLEDLGS